MDRSSPRALLRDTPLPDPATDLWAAADRLFAAAIALLSANLRQPLQAPDDLLPAGTNVVALWDIALETPERQRPHDPRRDLMGPTAQGDAWIPAGTQAVVGESHVSSRGSYCTVRTSNGPLAGVELFAYKATAWWAWVRADEPLATDRRRAERLLDDLRALERGWTDEQLNVIGWRMS